MKNRVTLVDVGAFTFGLGIGLAFGGWITAGTILFCVAGLVWFLSTGEKTEIGNGKRRRG